MKFVGHTENGLSSGDYAIIFVANRLSDPRSKNGISEWMKNDFISTKYRIVSSQSFWNIMERIDADIDKSINILEVIGPPGLMEIIEELEAQEGIKFAEFDTNKSLNLTTIFVDENKLDKDIEIPILSPRIIIKYFDLSVADIDKLPSLSIPLDNNFLEMEYEARDLVKNEVVIRREWDLPVPQDSKSVIAYYTDQILKRLKINSGFATFYPLVKKYVIEKLFSEHINLDDPRVLYKLSLPEVQEKLIKLFVEKFKDMTFKEREPEKENLLSYQIQDPSSGPKRFIRQINVFSIMCLAIMILK